MRQMQWTVSVKRDGDAQGVALATFTRPVDGAMVADFGLSLEEGRHLLRTLQEAVTQSHRHAKPNLRLRLRPALLPPLRNVPAHQGLARPRDHYLFG